MNINVLDIANENERRKAENNAPYNQFTGEGSTSVPRTYVHINDFIIPHMWLPNEMLEQNKLCQELIKAGSVAKLYESLDMELNDEEMGQFMTLFLLERIKYDFEFYAAWVLTIKNKMTAENTAFTLNRGQRKLLKALESMRLAKKPIRIILLKARQWGGSTLVQLYYFWIQTVLRRGLSSVIAAHISDASKNILAMYDLAADNLPKFVQKIKLSPRMGMINSKRVETRNCAITVGSAEKPESIRSQSGHLAHFSEVAFFPNTKNNKPENLITSIVSMIPDTHMTAIVLETTANGIGNYFHNEWTKAEAGLSAYMQVFVAWFEIDSMYTKDLDVPIVEFIESLSEYEWGLWNKGATLEGINWYRYKLSLQPNHSKQMQEFPSDAEEAFQTSGEPAFNRDHLDRMLSDCMEPAYTGELYAKTAPSEVVLKPELSREALEDIVFSEDPNGLLKVWVKPDRDNPFINRYIVSVDTGGRSSSADYSVISVIDRYWMTLGDAAEIVAEWRGHIDHDLLVWKAAQIATWYGNALLVFESNTHESNKDTDGDHSEFIFDTISRYYTNLYCRNRSDVVREGIPPKWGFHTNRSSKAMIIDNYVALIREGGYTERNREAIHEAKLYEKKQDGSFGNIEGSGNHDDIIMSRMIGLYVAYDERLPFNNPSIKFTNDVVHSAT